MEFINEYISTLANDPVALFVTTFVCMLFMGEPVVLGFAFIAATSGVFSFIEVLILAYITAIVGELFWFYIGRLGISDTMKHAWFTSERSSDLNTFINKLGLHKPIRLLFYSRFISGIAILVIIFLGRRGISPYAFIRYSFVVNAFWTPVVVFTGYTAGKGYELSLIIFEDIRTAFFIAFMILALSYFGYTHLKRFFIKMP